MCNAVTQSKNEIYFLGHLGLGDHIIQHGIVINLSKRYDLVTIFCKHHNFINIQHLCKNYNNIRIITVDNDNSVHNIIKSYSGPILSVGIYNETWNNINENFDVFFYKQANIDFKESYEWEVLDGNYPITHNNIKKPFCFVHDDPNRGFNINTNLINNNLFVFKPFVSNTIFDFLPILRQAKEIHCIDSSFSLMIDRANNIKATKYLHRYVRENSLNPSYKNDWIIIK